MITRRTFVKASSIAALTAAGAGLPRGPAQAQGQTQEVPNSTGANPPKLKAPSNAAEFSAPPHSKSFVAWPSRP